MTVAYLVGIAALLGLTPHAVQDRFLRIVGHLLLGVLVLELARAAERKGPGPHLLWIGRTLYPLAVMAHAWGELNEFVPLVFGNYWGTIPVVRLDLLLFGTFPTNWVQRLYRPWLDELMAVFYVSYYAFLSVPAVLLATRQLVAASAAGSLIALNYFTNFAFYMLVPTKGPRHSLEEFPELVPAEYGGYGVAAFLERLQEAESVVGAAFPSSHVSGATLCTLVALRFLPVLGWTLAPLTLAMSVATVYLGYHHAADPLLGLGWGAACYVIGIRWLESREELPPATRSEGPELQRERSRGA